jgi:hypothetical protein
MAMSVSCRLGAGLVLGALLLPTAGCLNEELDALGDEGRYDKRALDMYLTDVERPVVQVGAEPKVDVEVSTPGAYEGFYGEWEAKIDMKAEMEKERAKRAQDPNYDPASDQMAEAFAQGMAEMMSFALTIKEDKTFAMTMMFFPVEGRWEQKGNQIWLHPETVMGMTREQMQEMGGPDAKVKMENEEPLVLKISQDGQSLVAIDPKGEFGSEELVFKRKGA